MGATWSAASFGGEDEDESRPGQATRLEEFAWMALAVRGEFEDCVASIVSKKKLLSRSGSDSEQ